MEQYIGLDVSLKDTFISVRQGGKRVWRGKCRSDPELIAVTIRKHARDAQRVVFATGPLSLWFYHALTAEAVPAICIDARHAKAALDMAPNKTDADGLAHLSEVGFFREVRVKSFDSMLVCTLVAARHQILKMTIQMSNQIRSLLATNAGLERIVLPMLEAWLAIRARVAERDKQLITSGRASEQCQLLMSIPGIGVVTASSFIAAIEDPANFARSRSVVAWTGLTTRRHQSGEVDYAGHISRRGDNYLGGQLYETAMVIFTRTSADSTLRIWGLKLRERVGFKRAAVAVARTRCYKTSDKN